MIKAKGICSINSELRLIITSGCDNWIDQIGLLARLIAIDSKHSSKPSKVSSLNVVPEITFIISSSSTGNSILSQVSKVTIRLLISFVLQRTPCDYFASENWFIKDEPKFEDAHLPERI